MVGGFRKDGTDSRSIVLVKCVYQSTTIHIQIDKETKTYKIPVGTVTKTGGYYDNSTLALGNAKEVCWNRLE